MKLTPEQIDAFFRGDPLPDEVLKQIERDRHAPNSDVVRRSEELSELARIAFDPDGPLFAGAQPSRTAIIAGLRQQQDWTIDEVAEKSQLDRAVVMALESGEVDVDPIYAVMLADAYGVDPAEILRGETTTQPVLLLREDADREGSTATLEPASAAVTADIERELSDFIPAATAREMVPAWQEKGGALDRWLDEYAASHDETEALLVRCLAELSLRKDQQAGDRLLTAWEQQVSGDPQHQANLLYLRGRNRWYANRIEEAIADLQACRRHASATGDLVRQAQALIYLARIANTHPHKFDEDTESLIQEAEALGAQCGRKDIVLLAKRAYLIHLRVTKRRTEAIPLAEEILDNADQWQGLDHILDSIRVDLGLSLRGRHTEADRRKAETYYRQGIERERDDSHAGMCWYLLADLDVDRMLEAQRRAVEEIISPERAEQALREAEDFRQRALAACLRSRRLLLKTGDHAARQKVNRRLLFLENKPLEPPQTEHDVVHDYEVRIEQVSRLFLGVPSLEAEGAYRTQPPQLARDDIQALIETYFSGILVKPDQAFSTSPVKLNDFLRADTLLCLAWPCQDSLVVRVFGKFSEGDAIDNVAWFTIDHYETQVRRFLKKLPRQDNETFVQLRNESFQSLQQRVRTIQPLCPADDSALEAIRHVVVMAPQTNTDWMFPLEWLRTGPGNRGPGSALLDVAGHSLVFATSSLGSPFRGAELDASRDQFAILASTQDLGGRSIYDRVRQPLGAIVQPVDLASPTPIRSDARAVALIAHSGNKSLAAKIQQWELPNAVAVVLLFCDSGHYDYAHGPFADGVALQARQRLGEVGLVIASRVPVEPDVAVRLAEELLHRRSIGKPLAEVVTGYLQNVRDFDRSATPFEYPWIVLT